MKTMIFFEDLFESLSEFDKRSFLEYVAKYVHVDLSNVSTEELIEELQSRDDVAPNDIFDEDALIEAVEELGYNVE
jgi:hypothetical protein